MWEQQDNQIEWDQECNDYIYKIRIDDMGITEEAVCVSHILIKGNMIHP